MSVNRWDGLIWTTGLHFSHKYYIMGRLEEGNLIYFEAIGPEGGL